MREASFSTANRFLIGDEGKTEERNLTFLEKNQDFSKENRLISLLFRIDLSIKRESVCGYIYLKKYLIAILKYIIIVDTIPRAKKGTK